MERSYSDKTSATCNYCGNVVQATAWLLVDAADKPDLIEQIRDGTLNSLTCPNCHRFGVLDGSLLVYFPADGRILFSPAELTGPIEDRGQFSALLHYLRATLSDVVDESSLKKKVISVPRRYLPEAIVRPRAGSEHQLPQSVEKSERTLYKADPDLYHRIEESARLAEEDRHREDTAPGARGNQDQPIEALRLFMMAPTWTKSREVLTDHPELLSDNVEEIINRFPIGASGHEARRFLEEHHSVLKRARALGAENTFRDMPDVVGAKVLLHLSEILSEVNQLNEPNQMARRVQLCRQALTWITREQDAHTWANLQGKLGFSLMRMPAGNPEENIEDAIAAFEQALQVFTRDDLPNPWANTLFHIADAYERRIRGDPAENIDKAIGSYEQCLEVRTREAMPAEWAITMSNLGFVLAKRITGPRVDNIERAIDVCEQALQVLDPHTQADHIAQTQHTLGLALLERETGERAENIERALIAFQQALRMLRPSDHSIEWAKTMMNLGRAYHFRLKGNRSANLNSAIQTYQQALGKLDYKLAKAEWILTATGLSLARRQLRDPAEARVASQGALEQIIREFRELGYEVDPGVITALNRQLPFDRAESSAGE